MGLCWVFQGLSQMEDRHQTQAQTRRSSAHAHAHAKRNRSSEQEVKTAPTLPSLPKHNVVSAMILKTKEVLYLAVALAVAFSMGLRLAWLAADMVLSARFDENWESVSGFLVCSGAALTLLPTPAIFVACVTRTEKRGIGGLWWVCVIQCAGIITAARGVGGLFISVVVL